MRGSYRTIPDGPYCSERQRIAEQRQKQQMIENAKKESTVLKRIEAERTAQKENANALFNLWSMTEDLLIRLEDMRKEHTPKDPDSPWDETFCNIIQVISEVRELYNNLWFAWCNIDRPEFCTWI